MSNFWSSLKLRLGYLNLCSSPPPTVDQHIPPIKLLGSYLKSAISFAGLTFIFAGCAYWSFIKKDLEARCPTQKVMNIFLLAIVTSELPSREGAIAGWDWPTVSHMLPVQLWIFSTLSEMFLSDFMWTLNYLCLECFSMFKQLFY